MTNKLNKSKPILLILSLIGLLLFATILFISRPTQAAGIIHVNAAVSGGGSDGTSWANAYSDLQSALATATTGDEIWVANGTYTPGSTAEDTFQLVDNVAIYGGFGGAESVRSERDWNANVTVLSGDIDSNDTADGNGVVTDTANIMGTNSYHVVTGSGVSAAATLDGFTVTAGQATGTNPNDKGGGMLNVSGNPTLINMTFSANSANGGGGIFNNNQSSPTLTNVSFVSNSAVFDGGAVFNSNQSSPTFTNVRFSTNSAVAGGAVLNNNESHSTFINVTFSANSASGTNARGGGMLNTNSSPILVNSIFWGNSAPTGANIHNNDSGSNPAISYSLVEGSGGSGSWGNQFGTDKGSNLDGDPLFDSNLQLQDGSPAIDAGNTLSYTSSITTDLAGNERIQNALIDMGAFEYVVQNAGTFTYLPVVVKNLESGEAPSPTATSVSTQMPTPSETPSPTQAATEIPSPTATASSTATPSPSPTPIMTELRPGTNQITINQMIEGEMVSRIVYVQLPQSLTKRQNAEPYPVVFGFHGAGGTGFGFVNNQHLTQLIDAGNFVGVYPNGHSNDGSNGGYWNLGKEATTADDLEFVNMIIQALSSFDELDLTKMYGLGYSNGSGMLNLVGKSTSHFRAIAPMFSQQTVTNGSLTPATQLSVFQVNGDADTLIPVNGGESVVLVDGETFLSAEASALNWVNYFSCSTTAVKEDLNWNGVILDRYTYSNCNSGHEVKYTIAFDIGHSGFQNDPATAQLYSEIWAFFEQH